MLGYWLLYGAAAVGIGALAIGVSSKRGRKVLKRWHRKVWRWNAAGTKNALRATRPGKWVSERRRDRKKRPPRLTFGRRRDPGSPGLLTRVENIDWSIDWSAARAKVMDRLVGANRTYTAPAPNPSSNGSGPATLVDTLAQPCGKPTADGTPCERPLLPGTDDCGVPHNGRRSHHNPSRRVAR